MKKTKLTQLIYSSVIVPLVHTLDKRMKRIVAIGSLVGLISSNAQRDKELESRLSKIMDLTENSNSLTLPIVYYKWFWQENYKGEAQLTDIRNRVVNNELCGMSKEEAKSYASFLLSLMPTYLFYDSVDNIKRDIIHLVESIPYIFSVQ